VETHRTFAVVFFSFLMLWKLRPLR
jgi:hypothetical protein